MRTRKKPISSPDAVGSPAMYNHYIAELSRIGRLEFKLTPAEARKIAHEVLVVSVLSVNRIANVRAWLTAAMRAAAKDRSGHAQ